MQWVVSKIKDLSAEIKIALWACAAFLFIALMVLVIVFFVLTPSIIAKISLPLSSVLCALLMIPATLCFLQITKIASKRDTDKQIAQYKKLSEINKTVQQKNEEISSLKVSLENYKKLLDEARAQLDNQIATPLELQNITIEDRHILCTIPIITEKFYADTIGKDEIDLSENGDKDFVSNMFNVFNPMEDIGYRNLIVMEHKVFPQVSIAYKNIFVENKNDGTLYVYGVIPEITSKSTEHNEEHNVKFNEVIKTYKRLGKLKGKVIYEDAVFEKRKFDDKEKHIEEFNKRIANGIELKGMENIFTAMAQEHIRRYLLRVVKNKQIKFVNRYYDEGVDAKPFVDFLQEASPKLISD